MAKMVPLITVNIRKFLSLQISQLKSIRIWKFKTQLKRKNEEIFILNKFYLFMPTIVFERHFRLNFRVIDGHRAEFFARFAGVKGGT